MAKSNTIHTVRDTLVILSFLLMIAIVVFQWMEIDKFQIQSHIGESLKSIFVSDAPAAPAAPAAPTAPPAPMAP